MIKLYFKDIKPLSVNAAYYRNRKFNEKARQFRAKFLTQLYSQIQVLKPIKDSFDPTRHCLVYSFKFYIPNEFYFTKAGKLSHRSGDLDNFLKLIIDFLSNTKYNSDWLRSKSASERALYGSLTSIGNLGIDDKVIQELHTEKLPSDSYSIEVSISIKDLPPFYSV